MKNIFKDVENQMEAREFILTLLLAGLFLFLSFVGYTRFSMTEITDKWGVPHKIHISYYGFPFEMIGVLNPIGTMENYYINVSGISLVRVLWDGLFLNFFLFFLLAFGIVYSVTRLRG
jgi:hypothetical protein